MLLGQGEPRRAQSLPTSSHSSATGGCTKRTSSCRHRSGSLPRAGQAPSTRCDLVAVKVPACCPLHHRAERHERSSKQIGSDESKCCKKGGWGQQHKHRRCGQNTKLYGRANAGDSQSRPRLHGLGTKQQCGEQADGDEPRGVKNKTNQPEHASREQDAGKFLSAREQRRLADHCPQVSTSCDCGCCELHRTDEHRCADECLRVRQTCEQKGERHDRLSRSLTGRNRATASRPLATVFGSPTCGLGNPSPGLSPIAGVPFNNGNRPAGESTDPLRFGTHRGRIHRVHIGSVERANAFGLRKRAGFDTNTQRESIG